MKLIDYHIHCNYSLDNSNKISDIIKIISQKNFYDACIVAHFEPHKFNKKKEWMNTILPEQMDSYFKEVETYNKEFGQNVKIGLEVSYEPEVEKEISKYLKEYNFDFILGSLHYLNKAEIFDNTAIFKTRTPEELAKIYFEKIITIIETKLFDSISHMDIIRRDAENFYGKFPFDIYKGYLPEIAKALIKNKVCFEINTNPYQTKPGTYPTYPSKEAIRLLYGLGAKNITLASDAHTLDRIGDGIAETIRFLQKENIKEIATFNRRQLKPVAISKLLVK